jgi:hypothetical protein
MLSASWWSDFRLLAVLVHALDFPRYAAESKADGFRVVSTGPFSRFAMAAAARFRKSPCRK